MNRHRQRWMTLCLRIGSAAVASLLAGPPAVAIPQEHVARQPASVTTQDITEADADMIPVDDVFASPAASPRAPEPWDLLHRQDATNASAHWPNGTSTPFKVIGQYSERFKNMDVDELATATASNETLLRQQAERIPIDPEITRRDLQTPANQDDEERRMRELIRSVASAPPADSGEIKGLRIAITYLIMAAIIIVVIVARR